jgi:hypothetical protein
VVRNSVAFERRQGTGLPILGEYGPDKLNDDGEAVELLDKENQTVFSFAYGANAPWPGLADGRSLVLILPDTRPDLELPLNWRASAQVGGTPGSSDSQRFLDWGTVNAVNGSENDQGPNGLTYFIDYATGTAPANPSRVTLPLFTPIQANGLVTVTVQHSLRADEARHSLVISSDLSHWSEVPLSIATRSIAGESEIFTYNVGMPPAAKTLFLKVKFQHR